MRVSAIGNFVEQYCERKAASLSNIDIVVLDDFFITPLDGWICDGTTVHHPGDIECYLKGRSPLPASVKMLHTYDQWINEDGSTMRVGSGLTSDHLGNTIDFLEQRRKSNQEPGLINEPGPIEHPLTYAMNPMSGKFRNMARFLHLPGGSLMPTAIPADYALVT